MTIKDPQFGPQFDPADGTVGDVKLEKRWVMVSNDRLWLPARGPFTYDTKPSCEQHVKLLKHTGQPIPEDLEVVAWWCWPRTKTPAYRVVAKKKKAYGTKKI